MKLLRITFALVLIALTPACTNKESATQASPTPANNELLTTTGKVLANAAASELPFNMYRFMAADPKNVCLSPLSLEQAFGMVYLGTNGSTKSTVEGLFGFKDNEVYSLKKEELPKEIEFFWGNSIWVKPGKSLSPSYVEATKEKLDASYNVSLDLAKINAWIAKETHDKIHDMIKHLDLQPLAMLINAFYLNAPWEEPFNNKENLFGPFQSSPNMTTNLTYLSKKGYKRYFENEYSKWVDLPYEGGTLSMILALPKRKFDLRSIEEALSSKLLTQVVDGFKSESVDLKIPKFTMETELSLKSVFESMGYADLFKNGDFSRMTILPEVKISEIIQATYLKVDEKGTEAAAATAVEVAEGAAFRESKTFYANEPFLFLIRNKKSGKIYFIGRVYEPKP